MRRRFEIGWTSASGTAVAACLLPDILLLLTPLAAASAVAPDVGLGADLLLGLVEGGEGTCGDLEPASCALARGTGTAAVFCAPLLVLLGFLDGTASVEPSDVWPRTRLFTGSAGSFASILITTADLRARRAALALSGANPPFVPNGAFWFRATPTFSLLARSAPADERRTLLLVSQLGVLLPSVDSSCTVV